MGKIEREMRERIKQLEAQLAAEASAVETLGKTIEVLEEADDYIDQSPYRESGQEENQRRGFLKVLREHKAALAALVQAEGKEAGK